MARTCTRRALEDPRSIIPNKIIVRSPTSSSPPFYPHPQAPWSSRSPVSSPPVAKLIDLQWHHSDIALAAFGRKEIEIAEVYAVSPSVSCLHANAEMVNTSMRCRVSCTCARRYFCSSVCVACGCRSYSKSQYGAQQPLKGARIAGCLHM